MRPKLPRLLLLLSGLLLTGCTGSLSIWGVNVPIPGGPGDDDDSTGSPDLDFSQYDGIEYINLDWTQDAEEEGHYDCQEEFDAFGANSTIDDSNLCPQCDEVWTITLVAQDSDLTCLRQGSGIDTPPSYVRRIGIEFSGAIDFEVWRNTEDEDFALAPVGVGAFQGIEHTWSGIDGFQIEVPGRGFSYYLSGEGGF